MVFRLLDNLLRLATVLADAADAAAADAAVAAATDLFFYRHLRPLHRRSECPTLHSLAELSVELRQQSELLHHADCTRHRSAPDSDLL